MSLPDVNNNATNIVGDDLNQRGGSLEASATLEDGQEETT
jgi:hypothetical protein